MHTNLEAQERSVVGVGINEEMVNLLTYQRMVESASRFLSVVNRSLDAVIDMVQ
jgi:flagellar hook-associated protein 1 FlgK